MALSNPGQQNYLMRNHDRVYSLALAVLGVLAVMSAGLLLFLAGASAAGVVGTHLPDKSLVWVGIINGAYAIAIAVTLSARRFKPQTGHRLSRILNWALLPAVPGGTVIGLYGLLCVDKLGR